MHSFLTNRKELLHFVRQDIILFCVNAKVLSRTAMLKLMPIVVSLSNSFYAALRRTLGVSLPFALRKTTFGAPR